MNDRSPLYSLLENSNDGDGNKAEHEEREGEDIKYLLPSRGLKLLPLGDREGEAEHEHSKVCT